MIGILTIEFQLVANYEKRLSPHIVIFVNDIFESYSITAVFSYNTLKG